jgi:alpha-tubulin suppressor-like RCC1 family protein
MASPHIAEFKPGGAQALMVRANGTVWAWGANNTGQLGVGTLTDSSVPLEVPLPPMKQVAGGEYYSMALSADGRTIYAWGDNTDGELGIGTSAIQSSDTPVKVDLHLPAGVTIDSIAGGLNFALALLSNGQVVAWGSNTYGQAGQAPSSAGTVVYQPEVVHGLSGVTSISAGDRDAVALTSSGSVWAWGENNYGQLGPQGPAVATSVPVRVSGLPTISMIASGGNNNIAVDQSGNVYTWGRNEFGELGWGTVDPSDGPHPTPTQVTGLSDIVSVAAEGPTTLAADAQGNIYAFGSNSHGQVGNGTTINTGDPTLVLNIPTSPDASGPSVQVAAAHFSSYAFNAVTGQTYAWGDDANGELGIPETPRPYTLPVNITADILGTNAPGMNATLAVADSGGGAASSGVAGRISPGIATKASGQGLADSVAHGLRGDLLPAFATGVAGGLDRTPYTAGGGARWSAMYGTPVADAFSLPDQRTGETTRSEGSGLSSL